MALPRPDFATLFAVLLAAALATATTVSLLTGVGLLFVGLAAALGGAAVVGLSLWVEPVWPLTFGIVAAVLSGNSTHLGLPIGPDRILILAGLAGFALQRWATQDAGKRSEPLRVGGVHWVLFLATLWAVGSAYAAGTLTHTEGLFRLLDTLGLVPFAMFLVAPLVFSDRAKRDILLTGLVALGAYLGFTAIAEGLNLDFLVFPKYILDPSIGIHADRARGPFVEAEANGLALYGCAVACAIAFVTWSNPTWRKAAALIGAACLIGILFTLSRGTWLGAVAATVIVGAIVPELRRRLIPAVALGLVLVVAALAVVPGLSASVNKRADDQQSVWVRANTNHAALDMIADRPLTGYGWVTFKQSSLDHFQQGPNYPMLGYGQGCHNVFLSNAAELGLPGAFLWLAGFILAIGGALIRRGPPELRPWRIGLLAYLLAWLVVANVTPLTFAFPTLLLWTWAGVVWGRPRDRSEAPHASGTLPAPA